MKTGCSTCGRARQALARRIRSFSVPEIDDLGKNLQTISELGTISPLDFTVVGLGAPRNVPAGVVDGNYFEVMGLRPVLGRLLTPRG